MGEKTKGNHCCRKQIETNELTFVTNRQLGRRRSTTSQTRLSSDIYASETNGVHFQPLLQKMLYDENPWYPPLQYVQVMRRRDGPPLPMGKQLCGFLQSEILPSIFGLRFPRQLTRSGHDDLDWYRLYESKVCTVWATGSSCVGRCFHVLGYCVCYFCMRHVLWLNGLHLE